MLPRPQQWEFCMSPIKCALKLVSCGVLRYNRLSVVRVLSIWPYKLTERERDASRDTIAYTHTLAESAEDQFFSLARSLALSIISRAGIFLFLSFLVSERPDSRGAFRLATCIDRTHLRGL